MPKQNLTHSPDAPRLAGGLAPRRTVLLAGALAIASVVATVLFQVLRQGGVSLMEWATIGLSTVLAGWDAFRTQLDNHHSAEDDDLWPVLRQELTDPGELASVDAMVEEHRHIPPALAGVDAALRGGGELTAPVEFLSTAVLNHLAHEELEVLPLIEQHLTPAQWRAFLRKERSRRSPRERPDFLTWILDDASEQDAAAVLSEMPPPARLVYRRVLRPRYGARHRWQIPSPTAQT